MQHFDQPVSEWSSVDLADLGFAVTTTSEPRETRAAPAAFQVSRETLIRRRAYMLWEGAGRPIGTQDAHWLQAAREIDIEYPSAGA